MYIVCHIDCKLELHGADFAMIKGITESHGIGKGAMSTWDCYTTSPNNDHRQNVVSYRVKEGSFIFHSTHIQNVHRFKICRFWAHDLKVKCWRFHPCVKLLYKDVQKKNKKISIILTYCLYGKMKHHKTGGDIVSAKRVEWIDSFSPCVSWTAWFWPRPLIHWGTPFSSWRLLTWSRT